MKKMLIITLLVALLLVLFIVLLIDLGLVITGVVVVVTAVLTIVPRYFRTRCPKCGKKWALRGTGFSRPREDSSSSCLRLEDKWRCKFCDYEPEIISPQKKDGSAWLVIVCLGVMGVTMGGSSVVDLKKEISNFSIRSKLKSEGKYSLGKIISSEKKDWPYLYTVRYDGMENTIRYDWPYGKIPVGATVPVSYLKDNPDTFLIGKPSQTISDFRKVISGSTPGLGSEFVHSLVFTLCGGFMFLYSIIKAIGFVRHKGSKALIFIASALIFAFAVLIFAFE
jgi:hypothetical protein